MEGRAQILRSVFLLAARYTALYFAPSGPRMTGLRELHDRYLWEGTITAKGGKRSRPLAAAILRLKKRAGGLSVPEIDLEFAVLAAKGFQVGDY